MSPSSERFEVTCHPPLAGTLLCPRAKGVWVEAVLARCPPSSSAQRSPQPNSGLCLWKDGRGPSFSFHCITPILQSVFPSSSPGHWHLLSVSVDLPTLDASWKWGCTTPGLCAWRPLLGILFLGLIPVVPFPGLGSLLNGSPSCGCAILFSGWRFTCC